MKLFGKFPLWCAISLGQLLCSIHPVAAQEVVADLPTVQLALPEQQAIGAFRFGITVPTGVYAAYESPDLITWNPLIATRPNSTK